MPATRRKYFFILGLGAIPIDDEPSAEGNVDAETSDVCVEAAHGETSALGTSAPADQSQVTECAETSALTDHTQIVESSLAGDESLGEKTALAQTGEIKSVLLFMQQKRRNIQTNFGRYGF